MTAISRATTPQRRVIKFTGQFGARVFGTKRVTGKWSQSRLVIFSLVNNTIVLPTVYILVILRVWSPERVDLRWSWGVFLSSEVLIALAASISLITYYLTALTDPGKIPPGHHWLLAAAHKARTSRLVEPDSDLNQSLLETDQMLAITSYPSSSYIAPVFTDSRSAARCERIRGDCFRIPRDLLRQYKKIAQTQTDEEDADSLSKKYGAVPTELRGSLNGVSVAFKWCVLCKHYRHPRTRHCCLCRACVDRFDHHCPWLRNCIGIRNYRFFYIFIASSTALAGLVLKPSVGYIIANLPEPVDLAHFSVWAKRIDVCSALIFLLALVLLIPLLNILIFHTALLLSNRTATEELRKDFDTTKNPYSKGALRNLGELLLGPKPPKMAFSVVTDGSKGVR